MGNCWVICLGSRDGCFGLPFEPFSNWLHILLKFRQLIPSRDGVCITSPFAPI